MSQNNISSGSEALFEVHIEWDRDRQQYLIFVGSETPGRSHPLGGSDGTDSDLATSVGPWLATTFPDLDLVTITRSVSGVPMPLEIDLTIYRT